MTREYYQKCFSLLIVLLLSLVTNARNPETNPGIIPEPVCFESTGDEPFTFNPQTVICVNNDQLKPLAGYLTSYFERAAGFSLATQNVRPELNFLSLQLLDDSLPGEESYTLLARKDSILIIAKDPAGVFYGIQSLLQLLPVQIFTGNIESMDLSFGVPAVKIIDYPRFPYRGMHLDVSRHFFPVSFIKKYIDLIAMHKMNRFHWHLTDDNGWRIEIKKYPKLQEISAWRVDREDQAWNERAAPEENEKASYGGFYTQDEVKEVVAYAAERYITIIPEIEMPGHSCEVLAAYPELSCTGGPFYVQPGGYWPNVDIFCAGKEETFAFLEDVLDEVIELFPSEYIHIGGDEATKTNWEKCPDCQKRMQEEGLKDEKELQSYFIRRMEKYINSKGRQIIGWDEILEGGLAPGATVMSWRGMDGGIEAARQGHDVIMTPASHCYFDYYQADPDFEPKAIGGFTPLKKVYFFEPVPEELDQNQRKHILGAQGNVWTEYIPTPEHAEYMSLPRMSALAEVLWSPREKRNWKNFQARLATQLKRFDQMGVNYSRGSYKVQIGTKVDTGGKVYVHLDSEQYDASIYYTLNGDELTPDDPVFIEPFEIKKSEWIKAGIFEKGELMEKPGKAKIVIHKAIGKTPELRTSPSRRYPAKGPATLVNGILGDENYREGQWIGYQGNDMVLVLDLGEFQYVESVSINFLNYPKAWIFMPKIVKFYYSGNDINYRQVGEVKYKQNDPGDHADIMEYQMDYPWIETRYIKIVAENIKTCPSWHPGKGGKAWMFTDEVIVE